MTFQIIRDIIKNFPEIISSVHLVVRRDNCAAQYKSCHVFQNMIDLASEYGITVSWFYGEPGHGRGLIDGMSSFGCKAPLSEAIVTKDLWFNDVDEMQQYLVDHFKDKDNFFHFVIDEVTNASLRTIEKIGHKIKGCRKKHLISISPEGKVFTLQFLFDDDNIFTLNFKEVSNFVNVTDDPDENEEVEDEDDEVYSRGLGEMFDKSVIFDVISEGTYIGLRSPPGSLELFYVVKVSKKGIAKENMSDDYQHCIVAGEPYFAGHYLEKEKECRNVIVYKHPKNIREVLIHVNEIFATKILIKDNLTMDTQEYQSICSMLF